MAKITLYKDVPILEEKNFIVDDIDDYFQLLPAQFGKLDFDNAQYIKQGLNTEIKIELSQDYLDKNITFNYNYAIIKNDNGDNYYYFIRDKIWTSKACIKLLLKLDVLNTYNNNLNFTNKTFVEREHKTRFNKIFKNSSSNVSLVAKVDRVPESFGAIVKTLKKTTTIKDNYNPNDVPNDTKFYLIYRTPDNPTSDKAIECLLTTNKKLKLGVATSSKTYNYDDFERGYTYYILKNDNTQYTYLSRAGSSDIYLTDPNIAFSIRRQDTEDGYLYIYRHHYTTSTPNENIVVDSWGAGGFTSFTLHSGKLMRKSTTGTLIDSSTYNVVKNSTEISIAGALQTIYSKVLTDFDRSNPKLISVIECPYCPIDLEFDGSHRLTSTDDYSIDLNTGEININNVFDFERLNHELEEIDFNPINETENSVDLLVQTVDFSFDSNRVLYDTKLLNSETFTIKFLYDNFSKELQLELTDFNPLSKTESTGYKAKYKQSNTISSNLAFKLDSSNINFKIEHVADYDEFLISNRNNQLALFNNDYLNYMRTGYNYDKKMKESNSEQRWINTAIGGAKGAVGGALAGGGVGAVVGAVVGTATNAINNIYSDIRENSSLNQKIFELTQQSASVRNCDDINLFNFYNGNKLLVKYYEVPNYLKEKINNLYYYYGYTTNEYKIPQHNNRYWFDFIKCNPVFDESGVSDVKIAKEIKDELIYKFNNGVVYLHKNRIGFIDTWDFNQEKENWEQIIIETMLPL